MRLSFDYTDQAAPLTMDQVKRDYDDFYVRYLMAPDKIIVWEHQLDWMLKDIDARHLGEVAPHLAAGIRIWDIPLEVRKP